MKKDLIIIYLFERYKIDFIIQEKNEIISIGEKIVIIHDLYELEKEVEDINFRKRSLKNIIKIEQWCKEEFEGKPEYRRRTPRREADDPREKRLGKALSKFKENPIWKKYQEGKEQGLSREEIKQKYGLREGEMQLVERYDRLIEEYGKKKKLTGQDIGKASCTTNVQKCDDVQADLNGLIKKQQTKEGGQH